MRVSAWVAMIVAMAGLTVRADGKEDSMLVYIGTGGAQGKGIYVATMDRQTGELSEPRLAVETVRPSFLAIHPTRKFLYATSEISDFQGKKAGGVAAFSIDRDSGKLTKLNDQASGGTGPCYVATDRTGAFVLVANYGSGSVATLPVGDDGRLGEARSVVQHRGKSVDPKRQEGPHAHMIATDPTNKFALAADLGTDQVMVYRFDADSGKLEANDPPSGKLAAGAGPRHFAFGKSGKFVYVINELSNTVTAFAWDTSRGAMEEIQTITTLPAEFNETNYCAEVLVHPSGKWLYGSNRGHDSIAVFAVDEANGKLTPRGQTSTQGKWPRNFGIDPSGKFLVAANQNSDDVVVFRIDEASGALTPAGSKIQVAGPTCVRFLQR